MPFLLERVRVHPDTRWNQADRGARDQPIVVTPGEAESGSAGVQPDEDYPGRRCAERRRAPEVQPRLRGLLSDAGVMPPKRMGASSLGGLWSWQAAFLGGQLSSSSPRSSPASAGMM